MKMKQNKKSKIKLFFRSFTISFIIIFSCALLLLGFLIGWARMESKITGKNISATEIISQKIK